MSTNGVGRRLGIVRMTPELIVHIMRYGTIESVAEGLPEDAVFVRSWHDLSTGFICFEFEDDSFPVILPGMGPKEVHVTLRTEVTEADRLRREIRKVRGGWTVGGIAKAFGLPSGILK